jgi:predicted histidine transporter YuiF (NhaC family)
MFFQLKQNKRRYYFNCWRNYVEKLKMERSKEETARKVSLDFFRLISTDFLFSLLPTNDFLLFFLYSKNKQTNKQTKTNKQTQTKLKQENIRKTFLAFTGISAAAIILLLLFYAYQMIESYLRALYVPSFLQTSSPSFSPFLSLLKLLGHLVYFGSELH